MNRNLKLVIFAMIFASSHLLAADKQYEVSKFKEDLVSLGPLLATFEKNCNRNSESDCVKLEALQRVLFQLALARSNAQDQNFANAYLESEISRSKNAFIENPDIGHSKN